MAKIFSQPHLSDIWLEFLAPLFPHFTANMARNRIQNYLGVADQGCLARGGWPGVANYTLVLDIILFCGLNCNPDKLLT